MKRIGDELFSPSQAISGLLRLLDVREGANGDGVFGGREGNQWLERHTHPAYEQLFKLIHQEFGEDAICIRNDSDGTQRHWLNSSFLQQEVKIPQFKNLLDKVSGKPITELITTIDAMIPELLTTKEGKSNKHYKAGIPYRPQWSLVKQDGTLYLYLSADKADFSKLNDVRHAVRKAFNVGEDIIKANVTNQKPASGEQGVEGVVTRLTELFSNSSIMLNADYFLQPEHLQKLKTVCEEYKQRSSGRDDVG